MIDIWLMCGTRQNDSRGWLAKQIDGMRTKFARVEKDKRRRPRRRFSDGVVDIESVASLICSIQNINHLI